MSAAAVLGAAGFVAAYIPETTDRPPAAQPVTDQPPAAEPVDTVAWAAQARVTLVAVESQLRELEKAEAAVAALPERRKSRLTTQARELAARKDQLLRQQAILNAGLTAQTQLVGNQAGLTAAEQQLTSIEKTLRTQPSTAVPAPLAAQRDALQRSVQSMRQSAVAWRETLDTAARVELPSKSDVDRTLRLADETIALTQPGRQPDRGGSDHQEVRALPDRDRSSRRPRDVVTSAAPPVGRQAERADHNRRSSDGPGRIAKVAATVGKPPATAAKPPAARETPRARENAPTTAGALTRPVTKDSIKRDVTNLARKAQQLYTQHQAKPQQGKTDTRPTEGKSQQNSKTQQAAAQSSGGHSQSGNAKQAGKSQHEGQHAAKKSHENKHNGSHHSTHGHGTSQHGGTHHEHKHHDSHKHHEHEHHEHHEHKHHDSHNHGG